MSYMIGVNSSGRYYVAGVGGYDSDALYPRLSFETEQEAKIAAEHADKGYEAGYEKARRDIRNALGI